jgi:hypothetical protein
MKTQTKVIDVIGDQTRDQDVGDSEPVGCFTFERSCVIWTEITGSDESDIHVPGGRHRQTSTSSESPSPSR